MRNIAITVFGVLLAGTVYRLITAPDWTSELARKRLGSLLSWWIVAGWVIACAAGGAVVASVLLAIVSTLAMREFARLTDLERPMAAVGYASVGLAYGGLAAEAGAMFLLAAAFACVVVGSGVAMATAAVRRFGDQTARLAYGMVLTVAMPACAILLFDPSHEASSWPRMFLLVIGLTEINDIVAAWVGRAWGHRKLAPILSPKKTIEGFAGGVLATILLAAVIGPALTKITPWSAALFGLALAIAGTLGDLNMSALKRCAGVKDSGNVLPGQGGILDRIDSLTFTAPTALLWMKVLG